MGIKTSYQGRWPLNGFGNVQNSDSSVVGPRRAFVVLAVLAGLSERPEFDAVAGESNVAEASKASVSTAPSSVTLVSTSIRCSDFSSTW